MAIHLVGKNLPGDVQIGLNDLGTTTRPPIVGTVSRRSLRDKIADAFGLNTARFPKSGGRTVKAGTDYEITLICRDRPGATAITHAAGVYRFAPRAIVDLYLQVPFAAARIPTLAHGSDQ